MRNLRDVKWLGQFPMVSSCLGFNLTVFPLVWLVPVSQHALPRRYQWLLMADGGTSPPKHSLASNWVECILRSFRSQSRFVRETMGQVGLGFSSNSSIWVTFTHTAVSCSTGPKRISEATNTCEPYLAIRSSTSEWSFFWGWVGVGIYLFQNHHLKSHMDKWCRLIFPWGIILFFSVAHLVQRISDILRQMTHSSKP